MREEATFVGGMRVLIAEYAVGSCERPELRREGEVMLSALKRSFERLGHEVSFPEAEKDFGRAIERLSKECDAGLVIAPDDILGEFTEILEENTLNLGCPAETVRTCADKLKTTEILLKNGIPAPRILSEEARGECCVLKPRFGCGSEGVLLLRSIECDSPCVFGVKCEGGEEEYISTEFVRGEDVSVSVVASARSSLFLTVNKQFVEREYVRGGVARLKYSGGVVPYEVSEAQERELKRLSAAISRLFKCRGYFGVDFVLCEEDGKAYAVDVNPRATTSIACVASVINFEIAALILLAANNELPAEEELQVSGRCSVRF
ncbi:MAG: ATP-grasp domain-containing protein [Candidatus Methanospirare jalkutatii]|nr:ATP-grasp domain-containing protein [Candidatus Methanospirare jalkutatii]